MLRATIVICGCLLGILFAAIVVATDHGSVLNGLRRLLNDPWGVVTLLDLGVGLLFVAAWMAVMEPRPWCAALWIAALFVLGNVITLVFLLWRTRYVTRFSELFIPFRRGERMGV